MKSRTLASPLEDAMRGLVDRVPNLDLQVLRHVGGDSAANRRRLAEILDKIGYVIRERYRILGQVKALTAKAGSAASSSSPCPSACF